MAYPRRAAVRVTVQARDVPVTARACLTRTEDYRLRDGSLETSSQPLRLAPADTHEGTTVNTYRTPASHSDETVAQFLDRTLLEARTTTPARREPSPQVRANRSFAWGLLAGGIIVALLAQGYILATDDPYQGVPACTDQIADAGGICHGEPR